MSDPVGGPADRDEENDSEESRAIASLVKRSMGDASLPKEGAGTSFAESSESSGSARAASSTGTGGAPRTRG